MLLLKCLMAECKMKNSPPRLCIYFSIKNASVFIYWIPQTEFSFASVIFGKETACFKSQMMVFSSIRLRKVITGVRDVLPLGMYQQTKPLNRASQLRKVSFSAMSCPSLSGLFAQWQNTDLRK